MEHRYIWSDFHIRCILPGDRIILKSTLTGAVVCIDKDVEMRLNEWFKKPSGSPPIDIAPLTNSDAALVVSANHDEYNTWRTRLIERRNNDAHIFTLYFLPTLECQFDCDYCFENGVCRGTGMRSEVIVESRRWLDKYFSERPEIDTFRLILFGGEPLLRKDIIRQGLEVFHSLADEYKLEFWTELISNGELLGESAAVMLAAHEWQRVQITLDGPKDIHDARRCGKNGRPTFENIISNVRMLLSTHYISKIDIRISFDIGNLDRIADLIRYLASFGAQDRINLSLGLITATFSKHNGFISERFFAQKALEAWRVAKEHGFHVPAEFIAGPWCVAIARHSAVLQPNGSLQKCFCTVGRKEYDFGTVYEASGEYLRDHRFEQFQRTDQCINDRCAYLPMCGGGCIYDAVVAHKGLNGFDKRFCQKTLIQEMNQGLLNLRYG